MGGTRVGVGFQVAVDCCCFTFFVCSFTFNKVDGKTLAVEKEGGEERGEGEKERKEGKK